jgi:hypothetical protein
MFIDMLDCLDTILALTVPQKYELFALSKQATKRTSKSGH